MPSQASSPGGEGKSVTDRQASVLDHLDEKRTTTLTRLAGHMGVSRSTMSITVSRLVKGGYVARKRDETDTRQVGLTLIRVGARVRDENALLHPELVEQILRRMRAEELATALGGLETLAKYAQLVLRERKREMDED